MQITECITSDWESVQGISNNSELNAFSYSIEVTRVIKSDSKFNFLVPKTLYSCNINRKGEVGWYHLKKRKMELLITNNYRRSVINLQLLSIC